MSEETPRRPVYDRAARWYAHSAWVQKGSGPPRGRTLFARRPVRGIFRHVHAATKNDSASFRRHRRRKPGRGSGPFLDLAQDVGTGDGGPRSAAIFYRWCLLSGSPRSGIADDRAASAAGQAHSLRCAPRDEGRARTLRCAQGDEGRGDGRMRSAVRRGRGTGDEGRETRDGGA